MLTLPAYLKAVPRPAPLHAVHQAIADGESWLYAWNLTSTTAWHRLSHETGVTEARLAEIAAGDPISSKELEALARVWRIDVGAVRSSLPYSIWDGPHSTG
jgi:hypothetical protein